MAAEHDDPYDAYADEEDVDRPTRAEDKAFEIALDVADEQRRAEEERAAGPQPGHTEMCEGCHGSGGGYEDEAWDDDACDVVTVAYDHCPECGGCGFYDCDGTCETSQG
ncbi:hypothetical protein ABT093_08460 [Kitasatospora sp. NPDC002551]|uniref:hypothetical protein n=1 Tax=Kitasatospora sp. NPDC002551 TaxID=3154539 RepID=UPI003318615F